MTKIQRLYKKKFAQIKPSDLSRDMQVVHDQMLENEPGNEGLKDTDQKIKGPQVQELPDQYPGQAPHLVLVLELDGRTIGIFNDSGKIYTDINDSATIVHADGTTREPYGHDVNDPYDVAYMNTDWSNVQRRDMTFEEAMEWVNVMYPEEPYKTEILNEVVLPLFNKPPLPDNFDVDGDVNVVDELDNSLDTNQLSMENEYPSGEGDSSRNTRPGEIQYRQGQMSHGDLPIDMQVVNDQMREQSPTVEINDISKKEPYVPTIGDAAGLMRFGEVNGVDVFVLQQVSDDIVSYWIDGIGEFDLWMDGTSICWWPFGGRARDVMNLRLSNPRDVETRMDMHYTEIVNYSQPQTPYLSGNPNNSVSVSQLVDGDISLVNWILASSSTLMGAPGVFHKVPTALHYRTASAGKGTILALIPTKEAKNNISSTLGDRLLEAPDDLHITLAYLGKELSDEDVDKIKSCLDVVCCEHEPLKCKMQGLGVFDHETDDGRPFYASVDAVGMAKLRTELVEAIELSGVKLEHKYDFTPHMTLGYVDASMIELTEGSPGVEWTSNEVILMHGGEHIEFKLGKIDKEAQVNFGDLPPNMQVVYDDMSENRNKEPEHEQQSEPKVKEINHKQLVPVMLNKSRNINDSSILDDNLIQRCRQYLSQYTDQYVAGISDTVTTLQGLPIEIDQTASIQVNLPQWDELRNDSETEWVCGYGYGPEDMIIDATHSIFLSHRRDMDFICNMNPDSRADFISVAEMMIDEDAMFMARAIENPASQIGDPANQIVGKKAQIKPKDIENLSPDMQVVMDERLEHGYKPEVLTDKKVFEELEKKRRDEYKKPLENRGRPYTTHSIVDTIAGKCIISTEMYIISAFFINSDTLFVVQKDSGSDNYSKKKTYVLPTIRKSIGHAGSYGMTTDEYVKYILDRKGPGSKAEFRPSSIDMELANYLAQFVTSPMTNAMRPQIGQELHKILHLAQINNLDDLLAPSKGDGFLQPDSQLSENTQEDPDLKLGDVEEEYSSGAGPMSTRFDDKNYNPLLYKDRVSFIKDAGVGNLMRLLKMPKEIAEYAQKEWGDAAFAIGAMWMHEMNAFKRDKTKAEEWWQSPNISRISKFIDIFNRDPTLIKFVNSKWNEEGVQFRLEEKINEEALEDHATAQPLVEPILSFQDGFHWIALTPEMCKLEGTLMQHCGQGDGQMYSLRDSKNRPHVTVDIGTISGHEEDVHIIWQMKGKQNAPPDAKYTPYIKELILRLNVVYYSENSGDFSEDFGLKPWDDGSLNEEEELAANDGMAQLAAQSRELFENIQSGAYIIDTPEKFEFVTEIVWGDLTDVAYMDPGIQEIVATYDNMIQAIIRKGPPIIVARQTLAPAPLLGVNFDDSKILDIDKDAIGLPDGGLNENSYGDMGRLDMAIPRNPAKEDILYRK